MTVAPCISTADCTAADPCASCGKALDERRAEREALYSQTVIQIDLGDALVVHHREPLSDDQKMALERCARRMRDLSIGAAVRLVQIGSISNVHLTPTRREETP